jgi:hypothetical protein
MDPKDLKILRVSTALALGFGVIIALIAGAGLIAKWGIVALVIFGTASFFVTVIELEWVKFGPNVRSCLVFGAILVGMTCLGWAVWPHPPMEAELEIYYLGENLDGKTITLTKSIDPTKQFQPRMFIDPNNPSNFSLAGIAVGNEGEASGEVQTAYLNFPTEVTPISSPLWYPTTKGIQFVENWNKTPISPHQPPIGLYPFYGTPIPAEGMKIRLRIFYGKTAEATFIVKRPD